MPPTSEPQTNWCVDCGEPLVFRNGQEVHEWTGHVECTYRHHL